MTTSQPNLLELAKQGNVKAIAALINRQLQPKGITVKASLKDNCLQIMLESSQVTDQQALVAFIRKGVANLAVPSIEKVKVYGKQTGADFPAWSEGFEINSQQDVFSSNDFTPQIHQTLKTQKSSTSNGISEGGLARSQNLFKPTQTKPTCPRAYLVPSILVTLFAFLPVGIAAIIFASQVEGKYREENYEGAKSASNAAKILCIVGGCIAAPVYLLLFVAILAPSFDNQAGRARESEAKSYIGAINRAQQAHRIEEPDFASSMYELEIGLPEETTDYSYNILPVDESMAFVTASAKGWSKSYTGAVFELPDGTTASIVCQTDQPSEKPPEAPTLIGSSPVCASGSSEL